MLAVSHVKDMQTASEKILTHIAYIHSETKVKRDMFDLTSNQRQVERAHVGCTGAQKALSSRPHEADTEPCFYLLNAQGHLPNIYRGGAAVLNKDFNRTPFPNHAHG
ncbi:hypothetical protein FCV25MIE_08050 [Fagus crenata]